jgi:hypothetical protein
MSASPFSRPIRSDYEGSHGKLKHAARHWAAGGKRDYSNAVKEAREFGLPEEAVAELEAASVDDGFEVWPENWEALEAFLAVSTQWRAIGRADGSVYWQGLDYAAVAAGLNGLGFATTPQIWADLKVMEAAARNRLNGIMETD